MPVPNTTDAEQFHKHPAGWWGFIVKNATDRGDDGNFIFRQSDGEGLAVVTLQPDFGNDRPDLKVFFTLSETWLWKIREFQTACGLSTDGGYEWSEFNGKKVRAEVVHTQSKDRTKTYVNVNAWEPYGDAGTSISRGAQPPSPPADDLPF